MNNIINNSDKKKDENNSKKKNSIVRNKKELIYVERQIIIDKLNEIIKLEENNNAIIDNNLVENIDDNNSNNNKKNRRNKKQLYYVERKIIINKLSEIIKLDENNNAVFYDDLVENMELKEYLINSLELIKKYYSCASWGYFTIHLHGNIKKDEVTLIKSIYKNDGYRIASKLKTISKNGIKKKCTELYFIK